MRDDCAHSRTSRGLTLRSTGRVSFGRPLAASARTGQLDRQAYAGWTFVIDKPGRRIYIPCMRFCWDETKRDLNLQQHGLDFVDAPPVFEGPTFTYEDDRFAYAEQRFVTLGVLQGIVVSMVHTETRREFASSPSARPRSMSKRSSSATSRTDWARVRCMSDQDIAASAEHPEASMKHIVRGIARRGLKPLPPKASISLRLDADVLEWLKAQGPGYQTRINAILRAFKEASA